jgi:ribosomal protein L11 methyltransferase
MTFSNRQGRKKWLEITIRHAPDLAEAVANFLFENGAGALVQEPDPGRTEVWLTRAGFPGDRPDHIFEKQLDVFLGDLVEIFEVAERPQAVWQVVEAGDWAEKWKEGLAPIEIGRNLVVKPTWCVYDNRDGRQVLELDPGLAFGTGRHATTFMCLEILEEQLSELYSSRLSILDVGTGSGILAMACALLGQENVTAIDLDPETLPVAADNVAVNGLTARVRLACASPEAVSGLYDLILANLTARDLVVAGPDLVRLRAPGGRLVLSGILTEQAAEVAASFAALGLGVLSRVEQEEWTALVLTGQGERCDGS